MTSVQDLTAYFDRLSSHDWYFELSDDFHRYTRGRLNDALLADESLSSEAHADLYMSFVIYHNTGPAFGTPRAPMPVRPMGQLTLI